MSPVQATILVAVTDPVLHPEATHIAAATGRRIIDTVKPAEIARHYRRVDAVLIDAATATTLSELPQRPKVYFLAADPGPVDWQLALECHADRALVIPAQAAELLGALGRERRPEDATSRVLGISGSAGGAGASTLAAATARKAVRAGEVVLVDADPAAGGLDLLLGLEDAGGARWQDLSFGEGAIAVDDLQAALPRSRDGISVLTGARSTIVDPYHLSGAELISALESLRGGPKLTIVDLPGHGEVTEAAVEHCDRVLLLVPAEVRPVAAAAQQIARWRSRQVEVSLILRHRGWSGLGIAEVEKVTKAEVIAELGTVARLAKQTEMQGLPDSLPRALSLAAAAVLAEAELHSGERVPR
ncbi:septum site-determining protein Ssd [Corynebacterium sp. A21]|uniref:septum site-determining protein Ssd n=1 Tax=Corynebacterium sp. A21 TaxID=3457318 RepID=UPI003FD554B8